MIHSRPRALLLALALCFLTVGVFHGVRSFEFLNYDDPGHVSENSWVQKGLTVESAQWAFVARDTNLWHPLTWISHLADVHFFGLDAGRHHLVNLAIHLANTLLLFYFFRMATGRQGASFILAALFAVHPIHVESVAWISDRKGLLAAFFWLLGLIAYTWYRRAPNLTRYLTVTAALIAALLSKPVAVTFPVVLLILDFWPLSRFPSPLDWRDPETRASLFKLVREKVPWFAVVAVFAAATVLIQSRGTHSAYLDQDSLFHRCLAAIPAYGDYLTRTFWPVPLIPDYPEPATISGWLILALAFAGLALTVLAIRLTAKSPWILMGWLWFLIVLAPTSGVVDLGRVYTADRYMYLPLIGILVMVCWTGRAAFNSAGRAGRLVIVACGAAAILGCAWKSRSQVAHWADSKTLFRHSLTVNPTGQITLTNLGQALQSEGDLDGAALLYQRLVDHHPNYYLGHYNLGTVRARQHRHADAERHFRKAIELNPNHVAGLLDLSAALAKQDRADEAKPYLEKALQLEPGNEVAQRRLRQLGP